MENKFKKKIQFSIIELLIRIPNIIFVVFELINGIFKTMEEYFLKLFFKIFPTRAHQDQSLRQKEKQLDEDGSAMGTWRQWGFALVPRVFGSPNYTYIHASWLWTKGKRLVGSRDMVLKTLKRMTSYIHYHLGTQDPPHFIYSYPLLSSFCHVPSL